MNKLVRNALAVLVFVGAAVPVGYSTAQAGTTEDGCHDIVEGSKGSFSNVIKSATLESDPLIGDATVKKEHFPDAGVVHVQMLLEAASCTTATYTVVVESTVTDARGKGKLLRELSLSGDGQSSTLTFEGFIDSFSGYSDAVEENCVQASLRIKDSAGRTIDVAPDAGQEAVELCKEIAGGQAYGG